MQRLRGKARTAEELRKVSSLSPVHLTPPSASPEALALAPATATAGVTGVAFVHGTGKQTNALADYWTAAMVDSVRLGLPNTSNYVVINCDFEKYMWDAAAAGCLAGQLSTFIKNKKITDLMVITHSNGGNILRWILSNPTYDSRYPAIVAAIRWVDALAPSSLGTPLANAVISGTTFEKSLGWLVGSLLVPMALMMIARSKRNRDVPLLSITLARRWRVRLLPRRVLVERASSPPWSRVVLGRCC